MPLPVASPPSRGRSQQVLTDIIALKNISDEDFVFEYDRAYNCISRKNANSRSTAQALGRTSEIKRNQQNGVHPVNRTNK